MFTTNSVVSEPNQHQNKEKAGAQCEKQVTWNTIPKDPVPTTRSAA